MKIFVGSVLFIGIGALTVAWSDPSQAVAILVRSLTATACLILLARTQSAARWFARASRVSALAPLADVALRSLRLIQRLDETGRRMHRTQTFRLGNANAGARLRSASYAAAHLLPESIRRAKALERALDCRLAGTTLRVIP